MFIIAIITACIIACVSKAFHSALDVDAHTTHTSVHTQWHAYTMVWQHTVLHGHKAPYELGELYLTMCAYMHDITPMCTHEQVMDMDAWYRHATATLYAYRDRTTLVMN